MEQVTRFSHGVFVTRFEGDLTVAHTTSWHKATIEWATRSLAGKPRRHPPATEPKPPVRLHGDTVVLFDRYVEPTAITEALSRLGWPVTRPCAVERRDAESPLEEGFFSAVAARPDGDVDDVSGYVVGFVESERGRIGSCEAYLEEVYDRARRDGPVFQLVDFPVIDNGSIALGFACSVRDGSLNFWSRPMFHHK